ncbi:MAG TPA: DEAD/DEAH box helicase [Phycisphaerae bacterium]|nr:DEAD/DEAH box helicase [Phycisphaerae bacterium]HRY69998.1 DEAD/DEAH box helicase [Phycisphaerae bacterium]HSA27207.1 DEAD/DEAH box helicase [Phycisphaerae bacterium]
MPRSQPVERQLTLKDRLSRLTYVHACRLLGEDGERIIRSGARHEIDIAQHVYLRGDLFRLKLPEAVVTITLSATAPNRLQYNCTSCRTACEHVGAAFGLILEEKTVLGLAAPPAERTPVESLSEEELVRRAIEERLERARAERMRIRPVDGDRPWTDYLVTNVMSGKTYRVALRGWEPGDSYCSCPDFRINTLGTCKHILKVHRYAKAKYPASVLNRRYRQSELAVHLLYGKETELRLLVPEALDSETARIIQPLRNRAIDHVGDLVGRLQRLAALGREVTVYPDAEELINRRLFADRIASKVAEIRKNPKAHPLRKELLKTELLPYQLDGVAFAVGAGRSILADDMGLGKTIQGIGVSELLAREAEISKVLIVCPASVKAQWRSEIERFSYRDCQLVLGSARERVRQYENRCFFTVCNYEQVLRDILAIERVRWNLIILDEGQRIKNWEAKTSRVIKGLRSPFALVLSGTPLENRLEELYSVAQFVDDRRLGPAFRFLNRYRIADEDGRVLGYGNLAELRARLAPILLRRTRASVMQELPPRSTEIVRVTPTGEQLEIHDGSLYIVRQIVKKPYINEMDLLRLRKALLVCRMAADSTTLVNKEKPGYSSKLERLDELLERLLAEPDRKMIVFSEWTGMLDLIQPLLSKRKARYVRLDGSVPQKKRQQIVHTFQRDPDCRAIIMTNAGATGLNLQAANTVINVDLPWNPAVLEQRIGRAHRMGQKQPVQVFVLVTEQTIEEGMLRTLSLKHDLALAALDVDSNVDAVHLASNAEDLKRRLEVLLGRKPDAPMDESEKARQSQEADRLARREKIATAGGQLLAAGFTLLGELLGTKGAAEPSPAATEQIKRHLADCIERDEQGRSKLSVLLPDDSLLDRIAETLSRLAKGN